MILVVIVSQITEESRVVVIAKPWRAKLLALLKRTRNHNMSLGIAF